MFRTYLGYALVALGLYSYAQARGWSMFASEAQEFASRRAQEAAYASSGGSSSGRFGSSGGGFSGK
jgi:hypothetical protein